MKLLDVKDKIDSYFDNISSEEFYKTLIKYHMRTSFKGIINGKEFDNVRDYNAEMQRLIAEGGDIDAHADTRTIETPDNSFLFPGFAQCESVNQLTDEFINAALDAFDPDEFAASVNNLLHDRILPEIDNMPKDATDKYKAIVASILEYLHKLAAESDAKSAPIVKRLQEIEQELSELSRASEMESDRKSVIDFVTSLYENINRAIDVHNSNFVQPHCDPAEPKCEGMAIGSPGTNYLEGIKAKAHALFGL